MNRNHASQTPAEAAERLVTLEGEYQLKVLAGMGFSTTGLEPGQAGRAGREAFRAALLRERQLQLFSQKPDGTPQYPASAPAMFNATMLACDEAVLRASCDRRVESGAHLALSEIGLMPPHLLLSRACIAAREAVVLEFESSQTPAQRADGDMTTRVSAYIHGAPVELDEAFTDDPGYLLASLQGAARNWAYSTGNGLHGCMTITPGRIFESAEDVGAAMSSGVTKGAPQQWIGGPEPVMG